MNIDRKAVLQVFRAESAEALARVENALVRLERNPNEKELLHDVFRDMHTLKGDSLSLGFVWLGELAHVLEDLLDAARAGQVPFGAGLVDLLLRSVDALRAILPAALEGDEQPREEHRALHAEILAALRSSRPRELRAAPGGGVFWTEERAAAADSPETLRVDVRKLDRMLALAGEIAISRGQARQLLEERGSAALKEALDLQLEIDRQFLDLQELLMSARLVPLAPALEQLQRVVREAALSAHKVVELQLRADGVELDTAVAERIRAPLAHMIRNAVDHGIEPPDRRAALGKAGHGTIVIEARRDGSSIVIQVKDDGAGLDRGKIAARARALALAKDPEKLAEQELFSLIFTPGFSTASAVTELSGRGVGMDVVRRNVDALRGTVAIESYENRGTTFAIRLPLTLTIIEGLVVGAADESYVIPLSSVLECVELNSLSCDASGVRGVASVRGEAVPYVRLRGLFGLGGRSEARENVVLVRGLGRKLGLVVDRLLGDAQTVVKPLGRLFRDVRAVSGSAILGNGRVGLILDVAALLEAVEDGGLAA